MLKTSPAVFAVGDCYEIMIPVTAPCFLWVKVGDETYYDAACGVMRSQCAVHRVYVPMSVLDCAKCYHVYCKPVVQRRPYYTETGETKQITFSFYPVPAENPRAYHIADAHNLVDEPIRAAKAFGSFDFLILNGDLMDYVSQPDKYENIYLLCDVLTAGQRPVVFARGNHDMRGAYPETFCEYTPVESGRTYYTFRLGSIWGLILDCCEDKEDSCAEYGHTVACHPYRLMETEFLKALVARKEFDAPDIQTKLVICHIPFTQKDVAPFDIEQDMYAQWVKLLWAINPHLMICGHVHEIQLRQPGCELDHYGQPCPVMVASGFSYGNDWEGVGFQFGKDRISYTVTDSNGTVLSTDFCYKA